jgi:hypothetical protein
MIHSIDDLAPTSKPGAISAIDLSIGLDPTTWVPADHVPPGCGRISIRSREFIEHQIANGLRKDCGLGGYGEGVGLLLLWSSLNEASATRFPFDNDSWGIHWEGSKGEDMSDHV